MGPNKHIKGSKVFHAIMLVLNILVLLLLIASYIAYHIPPATVPFLSFAALAYPYILLANLVFVGFWMLTKVRYAVLPLIVVFFGWNHMGRLFQLQGIDAEGTDSVQSIRILSYNLQNFLKLNTSTTRYVTDMTNEGRIIGFLSTQKADIVCLQEMLNDRKSSKDFMASMSEVLQCPHSYYENYYANTTDKQDALAIFSRFPILHTGHLKYDGKSTGIFADLQLENDTIRVYNLHLASIHFKAEDYQFWSEIRNNKEQDSLRTGTFRIFNKIHKASVKRSFQVREIKSHMDSSPYPMIVCGDFNDAPSSYTYKTIARNLTDAFVASGAGFGSTYAGENFPSFRIDFIFHHKAFESRGFERFKLPHSDHYPISTYLYLK